MKIDTQNIKAFTNNELKAQINDVKNYEQRKSVRQIVDYLARKTPRLCLVSGLRRTGKTFMLKHAIAGLSDNDLTKAALININFSRTGIDVSELEYVLDLLCLEKIKYFFIDEATSIQDFCIQSKSICDNYCVDGRRIVLCGSNSLAFLLAKNDALLGRYEEIKTTWISFGEWTRLLFSNHESLPDIDLYLQYGGVLDFYGLNFDTCRNFELIHKNKNNYIKSAILLNIINSIKINESIDELTKLYLMLYKGSLINILSRVIAHELHSIALKDINKIYASEDLKGIINQQEPFSTIKLEIKKYETLLNEKIKNSLGITDTKCSKEEVALAINFLHEIDFMADDFCYNIRDGQIQKTIQNILLQPGIRTEQIEIAFKEVLKVIGNDLDILDQDYRKKSLTSVLGVVLEEFIRLEFRHAFPNSTACKIKWYNSKVENPHAEIDILLQLEFSDQTEIHLFEVKHNAKYKWEMSEHLRRKDVCEYLEQKFGKIKSKNVLYRGENQVHNNISYLNISLFLLELDQNPLKAIQNLKLNKKHKNLKPIFCP